MKFFQISSLYSQIFNILFDIFTTKEWDAFKGNNETFLQTGTNAKSEVKFLVSESTRMIACSGGVDGLITPPP